MPKIFGDVVFDSKNKMALCRVCGYRWRASNDIIREFSMRHKVTCPMCRVTHENNIGVPIAGHPRFMIDPSIIGTSYIDISDSKYTEFEVPVRCGKCNKTFKVKSRNLDKLLEQNKCPICDKSFKLSSLDTIQIPKPTQITPKVQPSVSKPPMSKPPVTPKQQPVMTRQPEKKTVKDTDAYTHKLQEKYAAVEKALAPYIGKDKPVYGVLIKKLDTQYGECTIQCQECGLTRNVSVASFAESRRSELECPRCKITKETKGKTISYLTDTYCGKVYNGLRITKIYRVKGKLVCDTECMNSPIDKRHGMNEVSFGDLTSNQIYCTKCGNKTLSESRRLLNCVECSRLKNRLLQRSGISYGVLGYNRSGSGLTCSDIYTSNGAICDKCEYAKDCPDKDNIFNRFSYIRNMADMKDTFTAARQDVQAQYPNVCGTSSKNIEVDTTRGIITFRDAYRGRDGQLYKFCKCALHGTEMLLSESEIQDFSHEEHCLGEKSEFQRFYNIDPKFLLKPLE